MPFTLTMPKLSPTMESGVIHAWHKKEGDFVDAGEMLLAVSTDKATIEHEALDEGYLRKVLVQEGDEVEVGDPIAVFSESADEDLSNYEVAGSTKPTQDDELEQEKDKDESPAEEKPKAAAKTTTGMQQPSFVPEAPLEDYRFQSVREAVEGRVLASPLARKLAEEKGLDLTTVKGSGPGGRIMSRDLERAQPAADVAFGPESVPHVQPGSYEEESLSPMRKVISQRLQEAKTFIPHFYVRQQIDAQPLFETREQLRAHGIKLTYNDFVVRASALALRKHPNVNSAFNTENQSIAHYSTIDISIAVSIEGGLITPIVRHADYKNLGELSVEIKALARRAQAQKLEPHEYKGGSFTISNLGMFGIDEFSAIINPPQACILAVGGILDQPVVKESQVVPGKTMQLVLSSDHRVVDGVAAAQFLRTVKEYLETPAVLLV